MTSPSASTARLRMATPATAASLRRRRPRCGPPSRRCRQKDCSVTRRCASLACPAAPRPASPARRLRMPATGRRRPQRSWTALDAGVALVACAAALARPNWARAAALRERMRLPATVSGFRFPPVPGSRVPVFPVSGFRFQVSGFVFRFFWFPVSGFRNLEVRRDVPNSQFQKKEIYRRM